MTATARPGAPPVPHRPALRLPAGPRLVECLLGVLAVALAGGTFALFYDGVGAVVWLAGSAAVAGAAVLVCLAGGLRWWLTTAVVAVLVLALAHTAGYARLGWYGLPTPDSVRGLASGLGTGLPKMLAVGLPADFRGDLTVPPVLLLGAAGATTVAVLLRTARVTPVALPALVVLVAGLALVASRSGDLLVLTAALVLVLLALLVLRTNRVAVAEGEGISASDADAVGLDLAARRRRSTRGLVALGLPVVVLVTVLALAGAWFLPISDGARRVDPRSLYQPPFEVTAVLSPLVEVRPQQLAPDRPLFTVAVHDDTDPPLDRVRVAALDTFDGALWTRARDFQMTGTTLPDPERLPAGATEVRLDVAVQELPQPFLPVVGEPVRFAGTDFAFDRSTGTAVSTRRQVAGVGYSTTAEIRPLDRSAVDVQVSTTPQDRAYTKLPNSPPWVTELLGKVTIDRETTLSRLIAIEDYLRSQPYSRSASPGHSYGAVHRALLGDPAVGGAEQYAAAFALLARASGYPARVAVGYLLRAGDRDGNVYRVSTGDAHAWPEVHLQGYGWVPFEPTNTGDELTVLPPRDPDITLTAADAAAAAAAAQQPAGDTGDGSSRTLAARVAVVAAVAGVALGVLLVGVVLLKWLRRQRRRRHGPPAQRVVGAWREVADRLVEAGVRVPASRTGSEVARALQGGPAAPVSRHVAELAPLVAGAVFAVDEPDEAAAAQAWTLERRIRRELGSALPLAVRLRAPVDPRSLAPRLRLRRRRRAAGAPVRRRRQRAEVE